jgi:hypothetical protein
LGERNVGLGQRDPATGLDESRRQKADDRDLEAVEDPDDSQADDNPPVKAGPRQTVEPRRDLGLDRLELATRGGACTRFHGGSRIPGRSAK